ncbi:MAG: prepilin-type N-terminal cleavage/methylation domain-containing protein [Chthonomonadales bacterium]|nr:prepilin-type N-terminal cleavage/methylation domain-containing protein [Chthonomonadales bacterium]
MLMHQSLPRAQRQAFTVIELLVVIAIIAILAAILFPVFEQARARARAATSLSNIRQIGYALLMYAADNDETTVRLYGSRPYSSSDTWVGSLLPYVRNQSIFFDPAQGKPILSSTTRGSISYRWEWFPSYGLNRTGYSLYTSGTDCVNDWGSGPIGIRTLASFERPAERCAIAPTTWGSMPIGWIYFRGNQASWPVMSAFSDDWSWHNVVWDTRRGYPGDRIPVGYADGHAGTIGPERFVDHDASPGKQDYCTAMASRGLFEFWGRAWRLD